MRNYICIDDAAEESYSGKKNSAHSRDGQEEGWSEMVWPITGHHDAKNTFKVYFLWCNAH